MLNKINYLFKLRIFKGLFFVFLKEKNILVILSGWLLNIGRELKYFFWFKKGKIRVKNKVKLLIN